MSDPLHESMLQLNPIVDTIDTGDAMPGLMTYRDATQGYGYTDAKANIPEYRRLLQIYGTEVGRSLFGVNVWSDIMKQRANAAAEVHDVIVTGIRFPNEVDAIKELGGELWWVDRGEDSTTTQLHASESSVSADDFDVIIDNSGTISELHAEVDIYR